ncbi:Gfo/Idh/MocA family protein [Ferruginibacter sp.]
MASRKVFLKQAAALTTGAFIASSLDNSVFAFFKNRIAPSDQINIGVIGINGMGWSDAMAAIKVPGVNIVALCDVDQNVINRRLAELAKQNIATANIKIFKDYRQLLDMKDVDAVIIGTPDHWHCMQMVDACKAGKDVYIEKPVGNSITECRIMMAAQQHYDRVVQAGQWQRSQQHFKDAVDFIATGQLGNIRTVKVWCYLGWKKPLSFVPNGPVPEGVDYNMWLGPAQQRPFNSNRFHFTWRWFWDYAGGLMTDWGVHLLDYALLGMKATVPVSVSAVGGNFADPTSPQETPDTQGVSYQFDHFNLLWDHAIGIENGLFRKEHGIAFIGNNGTLELDRGGWEVFEESRSPNKVTVVRKPSVDNGLNLHMENFFSVIRSRKKELLHCPITAAADIATLSQMGNIAFRSGEKLYWDKANGRFTEKAINKKYLTAGYHNGYKLPSI